MSVVKVAATSAVAIRPVGVANVVLGEIVKFADLDFAQRTDANGVWLANYALVRWAPLIDALVRWFPVERHQDPTVHQLPGGHLWLRTAMEVVAQQFLRKRGDGGNASKCIGLNCVTVVAELGQNPIINVT